MTNPRLTAAPLVKSYATVNGKQMAYHDMGEGDPVVFLHGNPTSSYLWRNVIPHMPQGVRCIAPDLIGMGDSDKFHASGPDSYHYVEHREYLDGLLDSLDLGDHVVFVVHDWGSALGFDWANRNRERVAGIAYMEAIVAPRSWDDFRPEVRGIFEGLRSPQGEEWSSRTTRSSSRSCRSQSCAISVRPRWTSTGVPIWTISIGARR